MTLEAVVARLAARDATRTEADLQADIYVLLTSGALNIHSDQVARLEVPTSDGTKRRLDIEVGNAVIEVKKDLRVSGAHMAEEQLSGYVATRSQLLGTRYVGILTDGTEWRLFHWTGSNFVRVAELTLSPTSPDGDRLVSWLEAVLATERDVFPSAVEIGRRLGAESPAHLLDRASLKALYRESRSRPEIQLKRELWAKLLRTAFGSAFVDDEDLFIDHTLLVLSAEVVAHAVVGFDITTAGSLTPHALARGTAFADSLIYGVVEADFFDWVLDVQDGPTFVRSLADRIGRFNWSHVDHDVLKALYESIIPASSRASLGEYYTPDWLAECVVSDAVREPLSQRVLDPSCGSGTFLFHAIRHFLDAADREGVDTSEAVASVTKNVIGMDVHPVAVTLARVTYLLAIGSERLAAPDRGPISIPVYLGDSMQWEQHRDLLGGIDTVTVSTTGDDLVDGGGGALFGDDLVFPRRILKDAGNFDGLVTAMADRAKDMSNRRSRELILPTLFQFGVHDSDIDMVVETFDTMRRLHATGRDHIWGYYVRNLIRPLWLGEPENHVDVLIGNPPWLRYSKMTRSMQDRYKRMAKDRGLLSGSLGASGRDLSTLFCVRAVELYLRDGGHFALVMPHGTLGRQPHEGFRSGRWSSEAYGPLTVAFDTSWDLAQAPTGFPMVSCVIRGKRGLIGGRMPAETQRWRSRLRSSVGAWADLRDRFNIEPGSIAVQSSDSAPEPSPYKKRFRQGAVLAPIVLLMVKEAQAGPLGAGAGRVAVESLRTNLEKPPWKSLDSLRGTVERSFVRKVALGESVVPFRLLDGRQSVLPIQRSAILSPPEIEQYAALRQWWDAAEGAWQLHKSEGDRSTLLERIDYHGQLSAQLPAAPHRVAYTKAGTRLAAARVTDQEAVIDFSLYWCAASSDHEALYLTSILNSEALLERVRPLQTLGLFGARHFDKYVFAIPIPTFDAALPLHARLVALAEEAEDAASSTDLSASRNFKAARTEVRTRLASVLAQIDAAVLELIPPVGVGTSDA